MGDVIRLRVKSIERLFLELHEKMCTQFGHEVRDAGIDSSALTYDELTWMYDRFKRLEFAVWHEIFNRIVSMTDIEQSVQVEALMGIQTTVVEVLNHFYNVWSASVVGPRWAPNVVEGNRS